MYGLVDWLVRALKRIVPTRIVRALRPAYHRSLAFLMALSYGFSAKKLVVVGITGTKGKSTTADLLFAILREAGYSTALLSTIRFAINDTSEPNLFKMTLPGRGFAQQFMRKALNSGCTHLVVEVTSESTLNYRHRFLAMNGLIVTNIQREHIESHGSFENYVAAKRTIVETLARSPKKQRMLVANKDIPETAAFLSIPRLTPISFSQSELDELVATDDSCSFTYADTRFYLPLPGVFNALNALAAIKMASALGVPTASAQRALASLPPVKGRVERIEAGQDFLAIVDYAHTPDSLKALYGAFPTHRKICVLGNTGGGRDRWKRPEMARIADQACAEVILTNEDPYDENPRAIVDEMAAGVERKPTIIMDRREAIRHALSKARKGDAVLISGKGTDPYIMGPRGTKEPWSDARVVREELKRLRSARGA